MTMYRLTHLADVTARIGGIQHVAAPCFAYDDPENISIGRAECQCGWVGEKRHSTDIQQMQLDCQQHIEDAKSYWGKLVVAVGAMTRRPAKMEEVA